MKRILYIALLTLSLGMFPACQDWLSIPSPTQMDNETVFLDIRSAEMAVLGAYASTFNRTMYYEFGGGSDECISNESNNSRVRQANYIFNLSEVSTGPYSVMYSLIERVNMVIKKLPGYTPANDEEAQKIEMMLGECYALRAFGYLNLIRYYGDVPYTDVPFEDVDELYMGRHDRDAIYDACIEDLQTAVGKLPWFSEGKIATPERISKNAAYGLLARVALYAAGYSLRWDLETYSPSSLKLAQRSDAARIRELYQIASDACEAVINRGENNLVSNFEDVFKNLVRSEYNTESMFEFGQYGTNSSQTSNTIGYTNGMTAMRGNSLFGRVFPMQLAAPTFWFDFEEGDTRRNVSIGNYGIDASDNRVLHPYSAHCIGKFRVQWKPNASTADLVRDINWIWLRYSDVLLMYAEAQNELNNGPTTAGTDAFKKVRTRAFGSEDLIGTIPSDYTGFRNAIIEERKLELAFEGWRKTDLVRFGVLYEVLTETKEKLLDLAHRRGQYASVPRYAVYQKKTAVRPEVIAELVPLYTYATNPANDAAEIARLNAELGEGAYVIADMNGYTTGSGVQFTPFFNTETGNLYSWVSDMFSGLQKNKSELYPLAVSTIEQNPTLAEQQIPHPDY